MYALVDCNNFYASCERVFNPKARNRPVVVLSNNDGCVIARSNEAKRLGFKMGTLAFQVEQLIKQHNVMAFSSNYTLYGDMSNRVMGLLSSYVQDIEVYSIDEAFLDLHGFERFGWKEYGTRILTETMRGTGIPLSMGIAPTKTLAKIANKFAKRYPAYKGVCVIDTDDKRLKALRKTPVADIWGIGRRYARRLSAMGVDTAYDFSLLPPAWVRKQMTVVGERIWKELHGIPCIEMELMPPPKKQICTSRAFGRMLTDYREIADAVTTYAGLCAQKLRRQKSCAASLMVFIHTNNFIKFDPQYHKNIVMQLPVPTDSTLELTKYALEGLRQI